MLPSSCIRTKLLLSVVACFLQSCVLLMWRGSVGGVICMVIARPLQAQVDCWKYHINSYFILCILNLYSYFCSEKKIFSDRKPELLK